MSTSTYDTYSTSTLTSSGSWISDPYVISKLNGDAPKNKPRTELIKNFNNIINELGLNDLKLSVAVFTKYESDLERDLNETTLVLMNYFYLTHPIITEPQTGAVDLFSYDLAVVSDILEYMPSTMARANVIKEALTTLKQKKSCYLIITTKSEEEVRKSENINKALSINDLISLALYAGANKVWGPDCMKKSKSPLIIATNGG